MALLRTVDRLLYIVNRIHIVLASGKLVLLKDIELTQHLCFC